MARPPQDPVSTRRSQTLPRPERHPAAHLAGALPQDGEQHAVRDAVQRALTTFRDEKNDWPALVRLVQTHGAHAARVSDAHGQTPLHLATEFAKLDYVRLFLARGADANAATRPNAWRPLHHCADAEYGWAEVAEVLLSSGADVDARDSSGETALFHACRYGHVELTRVLVRAGANVNATDEEGASAFSPLSEAACAGELSIVQLLIDAGADILPEDRTFSPEELAHMYGKEDVRDYLRTIRLARQA